MHTHVREDKQAHLYSVKVKTRWMARRSQHGDGLNILGRELLGMVYQQIGDTFPVRGVDQFLELRILWRDGRPASWRSFDHVLDGPFGEQQRA